MVDVYNMSFLDNLTNPVDLISGLSGLTSYDYLIGNLILLSFFMVFLIFSIRHDFNEVLIIDCFITTIVAVLLFAANLVSAQTIAYPTVLFFITLIFYFFSK